MNTPSKLLPLAGIVLLGACATVPTGPSVMVLPGSHKSFDEFQADGAACQQYAQSSVGGPGAGQAAADSVASSAVAGTLLGAAAGAAIGAASGNAGHGAAIGAGTGLLVGSAAGSNAAGYSYYSVQRRYDNAYVQCMYAKGNQVPVRGRYYRDYRDAPPGYGPPPRAYPPAG